jgi:DNA polymerase-3 subunit delta'
MPHAMLFFGPEGSGKEAAAIELARVLNCASGEWDACGVCPSCVQFDTLRHPQLKLIFAMPSKPDESTAWDKLTADERADINEQIAIKAANPYHHIILQKAAEIKISSIRDIRREASLRSTGHGRTVVMICEAERLNPSSSNALLKILEEPASDLQFILTTAKKDALLPTILSRCQHIRFDTLHDDDIEQALRSRGDLDAGRISSAVHIANGNYSDAIALARDTELYERQDVLLFVRAVMSGDPVAIRERIAVLIKSENKRIAIYFLTAIESWFRDVMLMREGAGDSIRNVDFREPLEKFAGYYANADCPRAIASVEDIIELIRKNVHLSLALHVLAFRLKSAVQPGAYPKQ